MADGVPVGCELEILKKVELLKKRLIKRSSRIALSDHDNVWNAITNTDSTLWCDGYVEAMNEARIELNKLIKEVEEYES
jgi:hypothetical protein